MKSFLLKSVATLLAALGLGSAQAQMNLLANPGFESGLAGWQQQGGASIRVADPFAHEGSNYVYGRSTPSFKVWQDVDLLASGYSATSIDAGALDLVFGGWQAGWNTQKDFGVISIHLLNGAMAEIGVASLPGFYSNHTWVEQSGTADLLAGSRFVRFEFLGTRLEGSNNDAYLDSAYLKLREDVTMAVPEPETYAMMLAGLGLIGFTARRRRQKVLSGA